MLAPSLKKLRYKSAQHKGQRRGQKLLQNTVHYLHSDHLCKKTKQNKSNQEFIFLLHC